MRRFLAVSLIAAFSLSTGVSQSQVRNDPPAKPDSLEALQAEALKNNPDIKVALAKLRLAEAKFERVRTNLKLQVELAHAEVEAARAGFAEGNERYKRAQQLFVKGAIAREELGAAELTMLKLRSEKTVKEAQLHLLLGRVADQKRSPAKPSVPD